MPDLIYEDVRISIDEVCNHRLGDYSGVWVLGPGEEVGEIFNPLIRANILKSQGATGPALRGINKRLVVEVENPKGPGVCEAIANEFAGSWKREGGRSSISLPR